MRCLRCRAELPAEAKHCPACWAPDPERCPPEEEERIWKQLATCNFLSLMLIVVGGMLLPAGPCLDRRPLRVVVFGDVELWQLVPAAGAFLCALGLGFGARAKGRSILWGFLGLLCFAGFVLLHFMGKRCHYCREALSHRDGRCFRCGAPI